MQINTSRIILTPIGPHEEKPTGGMFLFLRHVCTMLPRAYIGLGSNLGDRALLLDSAIEAMASRWNTPPMISRRYLAPAWGMPSGTPDFLNQVVAFQNLELSDPEDLIRDVLEIEQQLGRERPSSSVGYVSRTVDIDLLAMDGMEWNSSKLILPHPRMHMRKFVLLPLADIAPELRPTPGGPTVASLLKDCPDVSSVHLWEPTLD